MTITMTQFFTNLVQSYPDSLPFLNEVYEKVIKSPQFSAVVCFDCFLLFFYVFIF